MLSFISRPKRPGRRAPNLLMIGEMRDPESHRFALTAAAAGRTTYVATNQASALSIVDRICAAFDAPEPPPADHT